MAATSDLTRAIWLWLLQHGGRYTAAEIAHGLGKDTDPVFAQLTAMCTRGLVAKFPPESSDGRRLRYGVTGLCGIPQGMRVAEVQAC